MRNLLMTPHKAARMLAARLPFTTTLSCESVALLLMPFSENALDAKTHARIAQHIAGCPNCQSEVQMIGEMSDFFRANPPQTAAPAPNLWKSIEAQIQVETPERIAAFKANPQKMPVPVAGRFDWSSFARSFAATGGVMTAVVACVWIFAAQHPLEKPEVSNAGAVATASETDMTSIQLIPKRAELGGSKPVSQVATRAERAPVLRMKSSVASASAQKDLPLLRTRRVANASLGSRTIIIQPSGSFDFTQRQVAQYQESLGINGTVSGSVSRYAQAHKLDSAVAQDSVAEKQEVAQARADSNGGDQLPVVRQLLDSALEKATVIAVAASLSAQKPEVNAPTLAALPDVSDAARIEERANYYAGSASPATPDEAGFSTFQNHDAHAMKSTEAPAPTVRRAARRTQVAWLVEDGARSERSAVDATRTERRQQSLFSYGSR